MKVAVLIDGGHLRACSGKAGRFYDNEFIEKFANMCPLGDEYLLRVYYYDSPRYRGTVKLPVSAERTEFSANNDWLDELARKPRFAVRRGTLGFRGWVPKKTPIAGPNLTDSDFRPVFEQKGVDMRIGLDIATFSRIKSVDRIILVSGDQDMIPAMKEARKAGLEVVLVQLPAPTRRLHRLLEAHSDDIRNVEWPEAEQSGA